VRILLYSLAAFWLSLPSFASGNFLTEAKDLSDAGVKFTWPEVKSKSLKILLEYQNQNGAWQRVNLGSGFLISPDGLFVTAYHVMKFCLEGQKQTSRFSESIDCSSGGPGMRYKAENGERDFEIQIISHLKEAESTNGKEIHTPDEIIKHKDFIIGKLKANSGLRFSHWELNDFEENKANLLHPDADFELTPLLPPKRVFVVGYPKDRDFVVSEGFLNLTEKNRRGYFAADHKLYTPTYLKSHGISPDTKWGIRVENHMSGGAVVDASGCLIGLVVNGNHNTAGIISIENVLETFFSRASKSGATPAVLLSPTETPLYLRQNQ
jgi:hypothetical protein